MSQFGRLLSRPSLGGFLPYTGNNLISFNSLNSSYPSTQILRVGDWQFGRGGVRNKSNKKEVGVFGYESSTNPWEDKSYRSLKKEKGHTGWPVMIATNTTQPMWQSYLSQDHSVLPRDGYGCLATFPPEVSTKILHTFRLPPQFYPFLKRLGDDTPALKPYMDRLILGAFTNQDYEEMFYRFAKPLRVYRKLVPKPYRSAEEQAREDEVSWESAWLSYRQKVAAEYNINAGLREYLLGMMIGIYFAYLWAEMHKQYRTDMRLYYHEAPEHKVNWVKPRGDLS